MMNRVTVVTSLGVKTHSQVVLPTANSDGSLSIDSGVYRTTYAAGVWQSYSIEEA